MTQGLQRDAVVAALRADDVIDHLRILERADQRWRGRWVRARRCAVTDHDSEAFAVSRDGRWHCWSCDDGGDLLKLIALSEGIDIKADFPRVLGIAAAIAGVDDGNEFGAPVRPQRPERPAPLPLPPLPQRIDRAKARAAWIWERLYTDEDRMAAGYLRQRGINLPAGVLAREPVRHTPIKMAHPHEGANRDLRTLWHTMGTTRGTLAIVVPVRAVTDGAFVDLRCRRLEPIGDQPKVMGMVGGITSAPAERGKTRQLIGCYGNPHLVESDHCVVTEGLMDYLTALWVWPDAWVLGGTEAGQLALVAQHAARELQTCRPKTARMTIVEQDDPPRMNKASGLMVAGAADQSINEQPVAASKAAICHLGPRRVGWLFCKHERLVDGKPVKDLNDLVRLGVPAAEIQAMVTWWADVASDG